MITLASSLAGQESHSPKTAEKPEKKSVAKPARIVVETQPNAQVYLDDVFKGQAGPEGRLVIEGPAPGVHKLRVSFEGKLNFAREIMVEAGKTANVQAALAGLAGKIVVRSSPGAEVYLDDSRRGATDARGELVLPDVPPGSHDLRVSAPGKKNYQQHVSVAAGQETGVEAPLAEIEKPVPNPGDAGVNPKDGLEYIWIPPGKFLMGCSPGDNECADVEKPSHQVSITKGFWTARTAVTVGAYQHFAAATGRQMPPAPQFNPGWAIQNMPIVNVSWDDSQSYCQWAGAGGRLPTEAEWEYLARGGNPDSRYGPLDEIAWYADNSGRKRLDSEKILRKEQANYVKRLAENSNGTHPAGQRPANGFGLFDTLGNVWEWVSDWADATYYQHSPSSDPSGPSSGQWRIIRGGSWMSDPADVRVSNRGTNEPGDRASKIGFRCVGSG